MWNEKQNLICLLVGSDLSEKEAIVDSAKKTELVDLLITYFNLNELRMIMFDLGVDYEDFGGNTKKSQARELVLYLDRRDRLHDLVTIMQELRPVMQFEPTTAETKIDINQEISSVGDGIAVGAVIGEIKGNLSTEDINRYLSEENIETKPLHEAKMILVGEGAVGKTSIVKQLVHHEFEDSQKMTEGIAIEPWNIPISKEGTEVDVRLNIWDFGGQGVYQATHQLFFTKRSIYLLVLNARRGEQESRLTYWLKIIESFGEDAPVIIVTNKIDVHPLQLNENMLFRENKNIAAIVYTSCKNGTGIQDLYDAIQKTTTNLPHIHDELFTTWFTVKEKLEELRRKKKDYITIERYIEICEEADVTEFIDQKTLLSFLHDLGVILNFQDDKQLEGTKVLNPDWITAGIYKILSSPKIKAQEGKLEMGQLDNILDNKTYPGWRHPYIINAMEKFELCFRFEGAGDNYLVPDLLPAKEPEFAWNFDDCISLSLQYEILPGSIMTRFIVRMMSQTSAKNTLFWLNGALIEYEDNRGLITADRNTLNISVTGSISTRRQLLSIIRAHIKDISRSISKLEFEEVVPIPNYPDRTITYRELRNLEERKVPMPYYYAAIDDNIDVKELLDGIEIKQERNLIELRDKMIANFNLQNIKDICFEFPSPKIDFENLSGDGKNGKIQDLIQKLNRLGRIPELISICKVKRPKVIW